MFQSKFFSKTRKEAPKDEVSKNAQILIRGGFVHKEMAGVYSFLPLGLRVLKKIENVVREEMNLLGGQEVSLSSLQEKENWEKTGRWDDEVVDNWFKTKLKNETVLGLATTHEEPLTNLLKDHINSYRDLPTYVYQFQTKFRNEVRAKSGLMRCREFLMKDLYSFSRDEEEHKVFYEKAKTAYINIFNRLGIGDKTFLTFASGGSFAKFSHEFQTITDAGEDIIYLDEDKKQAINKEVYGEDVVKELGLSKESIVERKAVEVGNIFTLGEKFSKPLGLNYLNEEGDKAYVFMGSYGIGIGRLLGVIVETLSDDKGLVWPTSIAPFDVHVIEISGDDKTTKDRVKKVVEGLEEVGLEVLCDDRDTLRAGEKFADADLVGIPVRVVVSRKTEEEGRVEVKFVSEDKTEYASPEELAQKVKSYLNN